MSPLPTPVPVPDVIRRLIEELGPHSGDVAAVMQHADNAWVVSYLDDSEVLLTWQEGPARLEALTEVHRLPDPVERNTLEVLLAFNLLTTDTGGARMALEPEEHVLYMLKDLPDEHCRLEPLRDALHSLLGTADHWRQALMHAPAGRADDNTPSSHAHTGILP